uniref:Uncharacterized protein n=1 Tax=Cacopsylla melanoneura TaxID=428564 RepID=A0A8D8VPK3_9HEMI
MCFKKILFLHGFTLSLSPSILVSPSFIFFIMASPVSLLSTLAFIHSLCSFTPSSSPFLISLISSTLTPFLVSYFYPPSPLPPSSSHSPPPLTLSLSCLLLFLFISME